MFGCLQKNTHLNSNLDRLFLLCLQSLLTLNIRNDLMGSSNWNTTSCFS